jgi:hypothetical protein
MDMWFPGYLLYPKGGEKGILSLSISNWRTKPPFLLWESGEAGAAIGA